MQAIVNILIKIKNCDVMSNSFFLLCNTLFFFFFKNVTHAWIWISVNFYSEAKVGSAKTMSHHRIYRRFVVYFIVTLISVRNIYNLNGQN